MKAIYRSITKFFKKIEQMLNHPTSKALIERLKLSLENEIKELTAWKQKLMIAQKYEDAGVLDHILKELETLISTIDNELDV
jgi:hypothetical protein